MPFKEMSYLELWRLFCSAERKHVCNIFVEGIKRNNSVKLFWFRRRCLLKEFLSGALAAIPFSGAEPFMQF